MKLTQTRVAVAIGTLIATNAFTAGAQTASADDKAKTLGAVVVTATRSEAEVNTVPQSVTIVTREQIETQSNLGSGLGDILGKLVPGFAIGRESPSTFTQTFRGRNINVLIDGVPQSTNRNGARVLTLIDPSAIEKVEVIRGASAIYGDGATGGVINIITRQPKDGELQHVTEVGANLSLPHPKDSLGTQLRHTLSGKSGQLDYLANVSLERTGAFFDADGDRIPPTGTGQGTLAETDSYNFLGKIGYDIDRQQRLQFSVNTYKAEQDTDYTRDPNVPSTPLRGHKARAISGLELDEKERTENTQLSLDYNHKQVLGSKMHAQVFYRDYLTVYSPFRRHGGTGAGPAVFQSFIDSEKKGARLEFDTLLSGKHGVMLSWGLDYIDETTSQLGYVHDLATYNSSGGRVFRSTGQTRVWAPPYDVTNKGGFGQLEWQATDKMLVRGGLRREVVSIDVDDYININDGAVAGGKLTYSDTLFNLGAVYDINKNINVFGGFNQGFSLPDVGLVLRTASAGSSIATLNTKPQKVDNYEIGVRTNWGNTQASLAIFYSKNELGARSGGLNRDVLRAPERIYGLEATLDTVLTKTLRSGGTFTWTEGKKYAADGTEIGYLGNDAISPAKLTAYLEHDTTPDWMNRVQLTYSAERDRFDGNTTGTYQNRIDDYALVDWVSRLKLSKKGDLSFGVSNLFNKQYHNVFAQTVVTPGVYGNDVYAAASGATAFVSYKHTW